MKKKLIAFINDLDTLDSLITILSGVIVMLVASLLIFVLRMIL